MAWDLTGNPGTNPDTNFLGTTDNQPLVIKTNGIKRLSISAQGDPEIEKSAVDDTTPSLTKLSLTNRSTGGQRMTWTLYTAAVGGGWGVHPNAFEIWQYPQTVSRFQIWPDGTTILAPSGGNLGIGTTTPAAKLQVAGDTLMNGNAIIGAGGNGHIKVRHIDGKDYQSDNDGPLNVNWATGQPVYLGFGPQGTTQTSLLVSGNVGIGTMNPQAKLEVDGDVLVSGNITLAEQHIIYSPGRIHVNGGENLYLLNKGGVIVGKEWGGNGNLTVEGDVEVSGDVRLANADCAEEFEIMDAQSIAAGTVMVIDQDGALRPSQQAYDRRVAGVVSGGGEYKPAIVLDKQLGKGNRQPSALVGKVYCKVDAQYGPVEVGDLLTTSPTPGHAMKAADSLKACGAMIGKALHALADGQGLIPIMVALQ